MEIPDIPDDHPVRGRLTVDKDGLAVVVAFLIGLLAVGALLARVLSVTAGAAVVVGGLIGVIVGALMSPNRGADDGIGPRFGGGGSFGGGGCG